MQSDQTEKCSSLTIPLEILLPGALPERFLAAPNQIRNGRV